MQTGMIIHQAAVDKLNPQEQRIILAGQGLPLKYEPYLTAIAAISGSVSSAYVTAGQEIPKQQDLLILVSEIYSKLTETYSACTLEEIKIAFRMGVYDELGKYYGLNAKSFIQFVRIYLTSEERVSAKEKYKEAKKPEEQPVMPTPEYQTVAYWDEDKIKAWMEETNKFYQYYLDDNILFHATPEACYWLLQHSGRIKVTQGYIDVLMKSAQERLRIQTYQNKDKRSEEYIQQIVAWIASGENEAVNYQLRSIAIHIALTNYFRKQKQKDVTIIFQ